MNQVRALFKYVIFFVSVLLLLIFKLMRPFVKISLCIVGFHRYGHLALEPEVFLAEKKQTREHRPRNVEIWSFGPRRKQANTYLADKWKKEVLWIPSWLVSGLHRAGTVISFLQLPEERLSIRGNSNALDNSLPILTFSESEILRGQKEMREAGIDPAQPYVCLVVRDGGHYASRGDIESAGYDILNFDINTFVPAAEYLVTEGFQVVRMGSGSEKPFPKPIKGVIDYALSRQRSEFLDIFIAGTCAFGISTQTGPDAVCMMFRRPVLYVDVTRYSQFFFGMEAATWAPARLKKQGQILPLSEIVNGEIAWYKDPNDFSTNGIDQQKSTPQEIARLVKSYVNCLRGAEKFTDRYSRRVSDGMGERGRGQFGQFTARSTSQTSEILGEWVNN